MADPAEELEPGELVQGLRSPAPSEEFTFVRVQPDGTRKESKIRIRLLRLDENHSAIIAAQKYAKDLGEAKEYGDIYREAQAVEITARFLCRPKEHERKDGTKYYPRQFVTSEQLRQSFSEADISVCLNMYELVKAKYAAIESFDEAHIDLWAARLSDVLLGTFFLSQLDSSHWPELLTSLARRVRSLSESLGLELPSLLDSSESDQTSSDNGTGGSTGSSTAQWSETEEAIHSTPSLDRHSARAALKKKKARARKKKN